MDGVFEIIPVSRSSLSKERLERGRYNGNKDRVRFPLYFTKIVFFEAMCKYLLARHNGAVAGSEVGVCRVKVEYLK